MNPISSFVIPSVLSIGERTPDTMLKQLKLAGCGCSPEAERAIKRLPLIPKQNVYPFEFRTNPLEAELIQEFKERRIQVDSPPLSEIPAESAVSLAMALNQADKESIRGRQMFVGSPPVFDNGRAMIFSILCTRRDEILILTENMWSTKSLSRDSIWFFGASYPTLP